MMADMFGYAGKIARVDLTAGTVTTIETPVEVLKKFLGGSALGMYYMVKEGLADKAITPFDPKNMIQFMLGPTNGFSPNARSTIVTKSGYNFNTITTSGGRAASELKWAGWDGIQVVGKSSKPVYLEVIDDKITIKDATALWGKDSEETEKLLLASIAAPLEKRDNTIITAADMTPEWAALRPPSGNPIGAKRLGSAWVIGTAGENRVWYACVVTEGARAHGRYGAGAIMGDKKLKGIVIRGTQGQKIADKAKYLELVHAIQASEAKDAFWRLYGTAGIGYGEANGSGGFPIRNWQWCSWSDPDVAKSLDGPFMDMTSFKKAFSCPGCNLHCMFTTQITSSDPLMDGIREDMPDWEAMGMVGGNLGFLEKAGMTPQDSQTLTQAERREALAKTQYATFLHDNYGLDYIEGGNNIGLCLELYQRKLITAADLDGIELPWGDIHGIDALVKKIAHRDGVGDKLANGTLESAKYFAQKKGNPDILKYAGATKGYGQPAHGVRSHADGNDLEYMTVDRPTEHTGGGGAGLAKLDYAAGIAGQNVKCASDSLVHCLFADGHWAGKTADMVNALTGWGDYTEDDLNKLGARQYALARVFDLTTRGITKPKEWEMTNYQARWYEPLPNGPFKGQVASSGTPDKLFNEQLPAYWKTRGWSEDKGVPTADTLKTLGIDDIAEALAAKLR
jgi:aldehyde:ferredoxin oxidoreductase